VIAFYSIVILREGGGSTPWKPHGPKAWMPGPSPGMTAVLVFGDSI
jgi:hypothetical protein